MNKSSTPPLFARQIEILQRDASKLGCETIIFGFSHEISNRMGVWEDAYGYAPGRRTKNGVGLIMLW